jgi:Mn2+/Fe2+ NRAMP family transporter
MDMVKALEPAAGGFAVLLFFAGALSAGLSSLFPIMMVAPLLIADYRNGRMETRTPLFRILCGVACLVGLTVPVLGFNPVQAQIVSQIGGVFVLPLSIGAMIYLVNRRDLMGEHRPGIVLNAGLVAAFLFSLLITYTGCIAIAGQLRQFWGVTGA